MKIKFILLIVILFFSIIFFSNFVFANCTCIDFEQNTYFPGSEGYCRDIDPFEYDRGIAICEEQGQNVCYWNLSDCEGTSSVCGNNEKESGEQCDGSDLNDKSCSDFDDYTGGTLSCTNNCEFDFTSCNDDGGGQQTCDYDGVCDSGENTENCLDCTVDGSDTGVSESNGDDCCSASEYLHIYQEYTDDPQADYQSHDCHMVTQCFSYNNGDPSICADQYDLDCSDQGDPNPQDPPENNENNPYSCEKSSFQLPGNYFSLYSNVSGIIEEYRIFKYDYSGQNYDQVYFTTSNISFPNLDDFSGMYEYPVDIEDKNYCLFNKYKIEFYFKEVSTDPPLRVEFEFVPLFKNW